MMKKILALILSVSAAVSLASCGGKTAVEMPTQLTPDQVISTETASASAGGTLKMSDEGITQDGNKLTVTYVGEPIGSVDAVSIALEQFSDSLSSSQIWKDYETDRVQRADMQFIEGVGQDCYIAFPYINVYDRGCYIRISAGSGDSDEQKSLLISLASQAAAAIEQHISPEAAEAASDNVIQ
jgi:hypothetical protein